MHRLLSMVRSDVGRQTQSTTAGNGPMRRLWVGPLVAAPKLAVASRHARRVTRARGRKSAGQGRAAEPCPSSRWQLRLRAGAGADLRSSGARMSGLRRRHDTRVIAFAIDAQTVHDILGHFGGPTLLPSSPPSATVRPQLRRVAAQRSTTVCRSSRMQMRVNACILQSDGPKTIVPARAGSTRERAASGSRQPPASGRSSPSPSLARRARGCAPRSTRLPSVDPMSSLARPGRARPSPVPE